MHPAGSTCVRYYAGQVHSRTCRPPAPCEAQRALPASPPAALQVSDNPCFAPSPQPSGVLLAQVSDNPVYRSSSAEGGGGGDGEAEPAWQRQQHQIRQLYSVLSLGALHSSTSLLAAGDVLDGEEPSWLAEGEPPSPAGSVSPTPPPPALAPDAGDIEQGAASPLAGAPVVLACMSCAQLPAFSSMLCVC